MHAKKLYTGMLGPSCQDSQPAAASPLPPVVVVAGAALLAPAVTIYCISAFEEYGWMHDNCLCSANSAKVVKTCHNSANWSQSRNLSHSTAIFCTISWQHETYPLLHPLRVLTLGHCNILAWSNRKWTEQMNRTAMGKCMSFAKLATTVAANHASTDHNDESSIKSSGCSQKWTTILTRHGT